MASLSASTSSPPPHPFANSKSLLEIIPNGIDIEEEARLYEELLHDDEYDARSIQTSFYGPPSIFSKDIWLGDNSGRESLTFAQDVTIGGWINVGDKLEGAYIVYDCTVKTKEGTIIHAHKRYSDFVELESDLCRTLPRHQRHLVPSLPPKTPLARYRPAFLDRRRRLLQSWLSSVMLHPDIGGTQAIKVWIMS